MMSLSPDREKARWISIILAAGKGTRMKSDLAKVLHEIHGRSLLGHVLDTAAGLSLERTVIVVGHQASEVRARHASYGVESVLQEPQLGTGHAVLVAESLLREEPEETGLLVLYGDVPLLRESTLLELMERHSLEGNGATVLTARLPDPSGYGRILRDDGGRFVRIVEDRDLSPEQRSVNEINSGIYTFRLGLLLKVLGRLRTDNAQKEYYLTDALRFVLDEGWPVGIFCLEDPEEISGINTVEQLAEAAAVLTRRKETGTEGCAVCRLLRSEAAPGQGNPGQGNPGEENPGEGNPGDAPAGLLLLRENGMAVVVSPSPYNSGHLWVVPERHLVSFASLRPEEAERLLELGQRVSSWCQESYRPQAMNLGYNSGRPGEHLTLHVIPRWAGDSNFMPVIGQVNILPETPDGTRRRLLEARARLEGTAQGSSGPGGLEGNQPQTNEPPQG